MHVGGRSTTCSGGRHAPSLFRGAQPPSRRHAARSFTAASMAAPGAATSAITACATTKYEAAAGGEDTCAVCLSKFKDGETLKHPLCSPDHRFHGRCLRAWFAKENANCPTCRFDCRSGRAASDSDMQV